MTTQRELVRLYRFVIESGDRALAELLSRAAEGNEALRWRFADELRRTERLDSPASIAGVRALRTLVERLDLRREAL